MGGRGPTTTMIGVSLVAPVTGDWVALSDEPLDQQLATEWVGLPSCGAVVVFAGLVREHADGIDGVVSIDYEAWAEEVVPRMEAIAVDCRRRWPDLGRIVLWHREGVVALGEASVVIAVSAPHRGSAFEASRHAIDSLKATVPIWKKERSGSGEQWARSAQHITTLDIAADDRVDA